MSAWVYILASRKHGTLYVGATVDLPGRIWEHKNKINNGFTKDYDVIHLVWMAEFATMTEATRFEAQLKRWRRAWKIQLIEKTNSKWEDLSSDLL